MRQVIIRYLLYCIGPVVIIWLMLALYKLSSCVIADKFMTDDLICRMKWKDAFIYVICYSLVKVFYPIYFGFTTSFRKQIVITFGLYCFVYILIAFPYFVASIFQPILRNSLFHMMVLTFIIECFYTAYFIKRR